MSNTTIKKLAAAGALAGFLGFGGMSLASAQEDPSTTATTEAPAATDGTAPAHDDANCPNMGGDTSSGTADTTAPADASGL